MNLHYPCGKLPTFVSRRDALFRIGCGLGGIGLASLLKHENLLAAEPAGYTLDPKQPHFAPHAKSVIFIFLGGGPSHHDMFDPKPELQRFHGKSLPVSDVPGTKHIAFASPFKFSKHGQSGIEMSELVPNIGSVADDLCLIRSMYTKTADHGQGYLAMNTGFPNGAPSLGAWVTYGLGTMNQDLPAYVAMMPGEGNVPNGIRNWGSAWLPALYQGTRFRPIGTPLFNLERPKSIAAETQRAELDALAMLNRKHAESHSDLPELEARITNYELAARMQIEAFNVAAIKKESEETQKLYGLDNPQTTPFGRCCLLARRFVESGVRFVHLFTGHNWDHHVGINEEIPRACGQMDKPVAGLITDLKQRGLLDSTLLVFGGEFGRTPTGDFQTGAGDGRNHNQYGFSIWMAGAGTKKGHVHGSTDEFGYKAVENKIGIHDLHATILHAVGLDHDKLTFRYKGRDEKINGVEEARVVTELFA
jgi:hypothetical protein